MPVLKAGGGGGGGTDGKVEIGGRWSCEESPEHINALELSAAFLTFKSFCKDCIYKHVQFKVDNVTALTYINKMGGTHSKTCNLIAYDMWQWAIAHNIWLSACHVPGIQNTVADRKSRTFNDNIEWALDNECFLKICSVFNTPNIDIFASRLNFKLAKYFSWKPDPEAVAIDAFAQDWKNLEFYAFPPFNIIGKVLAKIQKDQASGILVVPYWSTQPWFPQAVRLLVKFPLLLPPSSRMLHLPGTKDRHPLHKKLSLLVMFLSGKRLEIDNFRKMLPTYCQLHGEQEHESSMLARSEDGMNIVLGDLQIPIIQS